MDPARKNRDINCMKPNCFFIYIPQYVFRRLIASFSNYSLLSESDSLDSWFSGWFK